MSFRCGFRYYIKNHISEQLSELESNEGVLQLGTDDSGQRGAGSSALAISGETIQANAEGNCVNTTGNFRFMADRNLMDMPLDVSALTLDWVACTTDKPFKDLTVPQRTILFLYYHEEQSFKTMGKSPHLGCSLKSLSIRTVLPSSLTLTVLVPIGSTKASHLWLGAPSVG